MATSMLTSFYKAEKPEIAAHKTLPFGTQLHLMNPRNGNEADVIIHDRGPFIRGRSLDVSEQTAAQLGMTKAGVVDLQVTVINKKK